RSVDCPFDVIGTPIRIGKTMTYAALFEMSDGMRQRLGQVGGFDESVLASPGALAMKLLPQKKVA
ncbi:MAG: hypothetical protein KDJ51_13700, partial [Nitratireductor sp.]|nr:hypothetical protein [Nitratireductor sp.]